MIHTARKSSSVAIYATKPGEAQIANEHIKNNQDVRHVLVKSHIYPEELPPEEDIKKLEKRIKNENEKLLENPDTLPQVTKK